MWIIKAAVLVALKLSPGCAQETSADLSILDDLSDTNIASKFASDPVLFTSFLHAAHVRVGGSIRGSASSSSTSSAFEDVIKAPSQESSSQSDEPFEATPIECTSSLNFHETFIPKFNTVGEIRIGGLCFEVQGDNSIYARTCDSTVNQQWVYDGTRIRRAQDPTKCIMGWGQDQLIQLHNCGSDESAIDIERFTFITQSNGHTSLDTLYDSCLYKDARGEGVLISGKWDSRCHDGRDPSWNKITFTKGLPTAGFKLQSAFNKCFSGSTTSKKINPLGNCDSSSWLLSLDPSDTHDESFKLKFVADNDLWLALDYYYVYELQVGGSHAAQFDIGNNFYNKFPGSGTNLSDYRLKVWGQTGYCLGWQREIAMM